MLKRQDASKVEEYLSRLPSDYDTDKGDNDR